MIGIAQAGGDPDDLIAIRGDDLHTPDAYLKIAGEMAAAGRQVEALDWARRGLATFADRHWQTPPLRQFLAAQLRAVDDDAGAEELWWEAFNGTHHSTSTANSWPRRRMRTPAETRRSACFERASMPTTPKNVAEPAARSRPSDDADRDPAL